MADYNKATNFTAKDGLPTGNAGKIIKGTEIDTEFTAIASAIASKANINSPTFTGTPAAPTATSGSNTTQLASTAFVTGAITTLGLGNMSTQAKTAVDITGGTIVGITDLAVADGGTGRSTLTANAVLTGNGTSGINSVAPSTSGNVLTSDGTSWTSAAPFLGLGNANQTYTDVTASRARGTSYTNSTGAPIFVIISADDTSGNPLELAITVNSVTLPLQSGSPAGSTTAFTFIVPVGKTYSVTWNAAASVSAWYELR